MPKGKGKGKGGGGVHIQKPNVGKKGKVAGGVTCEPCGRTYDMRYKYTCHTMDTMILAHRSCFSCQVSFLSADHYRLHAALRHGCPIPHKLKFREDKAAGKHRSAKRDMRTVPLDQGILLPPGIRPDGARGCSICGLNFKDKVNARQHAFFVHIAPTRGLRCGPCNMNFREEGAYEGHVKLYPHKMPRGGENLADVSGTGDISSTASDDNGDEGAYGQDSNQYEEDNEYDAGVGDYQGVGDDYKRGWPEEQDEDNLAGEGLGHGASLPWESELEYQKLVDEAFEIAYGHPDPTGLGDQPPSNAHGPGLQPSWTPFGQFTSNVYFPRTSEATSSAHTAGVPVGQGSGYQRGGRWAYQK